MDRDRDFWEAALFNAAVKYKRPIFGICRGVQLINIALGGTLWDDIPSQYPGAINHQQTTSRNNPSHKVFFAPGSQIAEICGQTELLVNSGHHQAVKDLGKGLVVTARAEDELIEAVELPGPLWIMGVQWHPEALVNGAPVYLTLFERLVQEAKKVRVVESPTKLPPLKTGAVGPLEKPLTERR
jgi:putative glutamine amidotransferase